MKQTPKEKAKELFDKFTIYTKFLDEFKGWIEHSDSSKAKQFALIAVNEIIDSHNNIQNFLFNEIGYLITRPEYWQEVKEEIEKL
jgi:Mn-dependent DtxR family transcriptional regulator